MFNDLPQNNNTNDDVKDVKNDSPQKKGLLQSLHSLTFSDDDDDVTPKTSHDVTPDVPNIVNTVPEVKPVVNNESTMGPSIGPSFSTKPMGSNISTPFSAGPSVSPKQDTFTNTAVNSSAPLYDAKPNVMPSVTPVASTSFNTSAPSVSSAPVIMDTYNSIDLSDLTVTFDTIENSLSQEMRRSIDSVKISSKNIKDKANYDLVTSFGIGSKEVIVFNTFLTKEMPYTSKTGKSGTQRVNFFGIMTERGVYALRVSSALTSKLEDALKYTVDMRDDTIGLLGDGTSRRFVMKLPAEDYGSNNILYVPLVGELSKQTPESFTGLDAVEVDMQFIEDLMVLAVSEVDAMLDYEKRRRANLKNLQDKTSIELKKASTISDKLSSLSL